ncbi:Protein required for attachment to host cells [Paracoccus haematequi]|uniref:Protein required for attachment to host cells n=1 Tax=Paracoccus haematequi TaxID=2491866 RepID=A0A447INE9_9RHOB|nr:host attachment protein [Paracoccus haematequi]VDS09045.1 Protein required for attachment to host cells [Paracoccus haematequi]
MLPHNALVVVADGHSARLFRNTAKHGLELTETEQLTLASLNRPKAGDAIPDVVPGDDPDLFAAQLADHLNAMVLKHKVDDIAVIADPSTLGVLRKRYHKELQFRLRKEVTKNLSNSDLRAIEDALA